MACIVHGVTKSQTQLSDFHFTPNRNVCGPFASPWRDGFLWLSASSEDSF